MKIPLPDTAVHIAVAALCGVAVGVEREWSARERKRPPEFAGVRTFLLLGLLGGLAGELQGRGFLALAIALAVGAVGLVVVSYIATASRRCPCCRC